MSQINKASHKSIKQLEKLSGRKLTLGLFLLTIRECEEVTQKDFAAKLGISRQYLCDIENDRRNISLEKAILFAKKNRLLKRSNGSSSTTRHS